MAATCITLTTALAPFFPYNQAFHTDRKRKIRRDPETSNSNDEDKKQKVDEVPPLTLENDSQKDNNIYYSPSHHESRMDESLFRQDCVSVGNTLCIVGSVHFTKCNYDKAEDAYWEAHHLLSRTSGEDHLDVAIVNSHIGDVYLARHYTDMALVKYREALNVLWAQLAENDQKVMNLLEKIALVEMNMPEEAHVLILTLFLNGDNGLTSESDTEGQVEAVDRLVEKAKSEKNKLENVKQRWMHFREQEEVKFLFAKISLVESSELEEAQKLTLSSSRNAKDGMAPNDDEDLENHRTIKALDRLRDEVEEDMKYVDLVKRQLEIDMMKEKLQIRRETRALAEGLENINSGVSNGTNHPFPRAIERMHL